MEQNNKIKIHVKNNHWVPDSFPNTPESEKVFTITNEHFKQALKFFPDIEKKVDIFVDWDEDNFAESMATANVLLTWDFPTINLQNIAPKLQWIHIISAGVEHLLPLDWIPDNVVLTNSSGVHSEKSGEFGLMSILMLHNHLPPIIGNQRAKRFESLFGNPIAESTIVIVGTGNLGGSVARLLSPLGPKIIGVNRHGNSVEGCAEIVTIDKLESVLPKADILYLAVPETNETQNLIDRKKLSILKRSCKIINVGRQSVMDYDALCDKLEAGELASAMLDVFSPEPIPSDSRLWTVPNLLITPHVSSDDGSSYIKLTLDLFIKNLELFLSSKSLINQVNKKLGY